MSGSSISTSMTRGGGGGGTSRSGGEPAVVNRRWLIVTGDLVRTGGMDRANLALAEFLADRGVDTRLVAFRAESRLIDRANVRHDRVPLPFRSYTLGLPLLARAGARAARQVLASGGRVVVNGGNCRCADVNWVHYVHAAYRPEGRPGAMARLRLGWSRMRELVKERAALQTARRVVVNSHRTRADVIALGVRPDAVSVVYYGIDAAEFLPPEDRAGGLDEARATRAELGIPPNAPLAVFVGALGDRRKGLDTLFAAWRQLAAGGAPPSLLVAGSGRELRMWEQHIRSAGLSDYVRLLGFRHDVPRLLRAADLLVSPARYEAYGLGVHEAICCGIPAIVSRSAGVAERYPADLAGDLLIDNPSDPDELARRLRGWRADVEGWKRRVRPFSDLLRARSWDDMAAEFVAVAEADDVPTMHR